MKLYHATPIENKDNILKCGLQPGMTSNFDRWIKENGIYGFTQLEDALGFAKDQCWNGGVVVFSFDVENLILDPEYDDPIYGLAYFLATEDSVEATLECEIEY